MASANLKKLREQLRAPAARIRQLADLISAENRDFTAEEKVEWEKANAEYNRLEAQINALLQADHVEDRINDPAGDPDVGRNLSPRRPAASAEVQALALQGWMRYQAGMDVEQRHEDAARTAGVRLNSTYYTFNRRPGIRQQQFWDGQAREHNFRAALNPAKPDTGGVLIPTGFIDTFEIAMLAFGAMRQVAEVMTTATGEPMPWPTANDTGNEGRLISDRAPTINDVDPSFGAVMFNAYGYTSDFVKIPFALLEDSAFDLESMTGNMLGERVGRRLNRDCTTGDGAAKPYGIVNKATTGVTAASPTAIAADELFALQHSVDPAYRGPGAGWMFHDNILLALRRLKDGNGRYLWQEGMSQGAPNLLLNNPYAINQHMASSIASAAITIVFGQLNKYKIRDVGQVRLRRLDERFADSDQVAFVALTRHDGNLVDAGTRPVKSLVQA